jgi:hypothetical protein
MRDLATSDLNDPRGFLHQSHIHCHNCGGGGSDRFLPWHRACLYFHEKILGTLSATSISVCRIGIGRTRRIAPCQAPTRRRTTAQILCLTRLAVWLLATFWMRWTVSPRRHCPKPTSPISRLSSKAARTDPSTTRLAGTCPSSTLLPRPDLLCLSRQRRQALVRLDQGRRVAHRSYYRRLAEPDPRVL